MPNLNKVMIIGTLTADPKTRNTPSGTAVTDLRLALNQKRKDGQEETTFLDAICWGRTAEIAAQYLAKGRQCFIEGRLQMDSWQDKQTGQQRSRIRVIAENLQLMSGRNSGTSAKPTTHSGTKSEIPNYSQQQKSPAQMSGSSAEDEDIPF